MLYNMFCLFDWLIDWLIDYQYAIVVDCGSIGPFYNGFKDEYSTTYGATIKFLSVLVFSCIILLLTS